MAEERNERMDKIVFNSTLPPIKVKHQSLERVDESIFRSKCPSCKDGRLLMKRASLKCLYLSKEDMCISCGRRFIYTDIEENKMIPVYKKEDNGKNDIGSAD
jgi:hypothetical protein